MTIVVTNMNPHSNTAGGPRRDWKSLSEINPPPNPPMMPKKQSNRPQCSTIYSAPVCFTSAAKIVYHCMMPLRITPDVSSTAANMSINGLPKTFLSRSVVESSTCICPEEASAVSKGGK